VEIGDTQSDVPSSVNVSLNVMYIVLILKVAVCNNVNIEHVQKISLLTGRNVFLKKYLFEISPLVYNILEDMSLICCTWSIFHQKLYPMTKEIAFFIPNSNWIKSSAISVEMRAFRNMVMVWARLSERATVKSCTNYIVYHLYHGQSKSPIF